MYREGKRSYTVVLCAKLLGISKEGLRYYTELGIINPEIDPQSGYKLYSLAEGATVNTCRKYGKYGLRMKEAADMIQTANHALVEERLSGQIDAIEQEIQEKQRIKSSLKEKIDQIHTLSQHAGTFVQVIRPAMYFLPSRLGGDILDSPRAVALTRRWNDYCPFTDYAILWEKPRLIGEEGATYAGHVVEADLLYDIDTDGTTYYPAARCMYTTSSVADYLPGKTNPFAPMLQHMKEHQLRPAGEGIGRIVRMERTPQSEYIYHFELWVPVEEDC